MVPNLSGGGVNLSGGRGQSIRREGSIYQGEGSIKTTRECKVSLTALVL